MTSSIDPIATSIQRVAAAAQAADAAGMVLTARCEHHIRGVDDFEATMTRLLEYRDAGAHVLYAPGLAHLEQISRVVDKTGLAINVLLLPGGPSVGQLADVGVRRVSLGSSLANIAMGAMVRAAQRLLEPGTLGADEPFLSRDMAKSAFLQPT